jgi:GH24 family phage-related lysozyme (muramidase)
MNAALPLFLFLSLPTPTAFPHEAKALCLRTLIAAQLEHFEGFREAPHLCTQKQWTIGFGHKLTHDYVSHAPITKQQALELLRKDVLAAEVGARKVFPDFASLPPLAQEALTHMSFQLGTPGLAKFHNLKKAINHQDWPRAGAECIASRWAIQTPTRARFCAALFGKIKP